MYATRRYAAIAGVLFLVGTAAGVLSVVGAADGPEYLQALATGKSQVVAGALFQCIMAVAYAGMALALHPVLKQYSSTAASGFVGFRIASAALNIAGALLLLVLLELSMRYLSGGATSSAQFLLIGDLLRHSRDLTNHFAVIVTLCLGDTLFYWILYRARLVPAFLSVWGFIGVGLAMGASVLVLAGTIEVVTSVYLGLTAILGVQQMALALWLIFKGLDVSAGASRYPRVAIGV